MNATKRVRCSQACLYCHKRKSRCVRTLQLDGTLQCDNCVRDQVLCQQRQSKRRGPKRRSLAISELLNNELEPTKPLTSCARPSHINPPPLNNLLEEFFSDKVDARLRAAIVAYYTYFYGFCPILHPSTLLRSAVNGTMNVWLMDTLIAITARFIGVDPDVDADTRLSRVVSRLTVSAGLPTTDEVCALQLASIGVSGRQGFACYDTLKAAATNLMVQLGWHQLDTHDTDVGSWDEWVERETKRRVFWINYKIDSHQAHIAGRSPVIDETVVRLRPPCSDALWDDFSLELLKNEEILDWQTWVFRYITPYESFMARIGALQRNAQSSSDRSPLGSRAVFKRYQRELESWKSGQMAAKEWKDSGGSVWQASFFGDLGQRRFLVRVRWYCLNIYGFGVTILLHQSNRLSIFQESPATSDDPVLNLISQTFGSCWCQGLVARDIDPQSWSECVEAARGLAQCLRDNQDIPLQFVDMVVPFFVFISICVLARQGGNLEDVHSMWMAMRELAQVWRLEAMMGILGQMRVPEIVREAEERGMAVVTTTTVNDLR